MKSLIIFIVIAVVLFAGYLLVGKHDIRDQGEQTTSSGSTLSEVMPTLNDGVAVNAEKVSEAVAPTKIEGAGIYMAYDADKVAKSTAHHIILFFHATWCPSCRALDADIVKNAKNIPGMVEIYKVDYDTSIALKKKYGITTQHSIIEIAADGTAKGNITHPATLADVLKTF